MRPLGRPPMPRAISSPSEPEDTASMSIERSFLPSFITEPLPNCRSIWESAAARALLLSMEDPSTIRRAVADIGSCSLWRGFASGTNGPRIRSNVQLMEPCTTFVLCSQYVLLAQGVLSVVKPQCPKLNLGVSQFQV